MPGSIFSSQQTEAASCNAEIGLESGRRDQLTIHVYHGQLPVGTSAFFTKKTLQAQLPERATNLKAVNRIRKIIAQISL